LYKVEGATKVIRQLAIFEDAPLITMFTFGGVAIIIDPFNTFDDTQPYRVLELEDGTYGIGKLDNNEDPQPFPMLKFERVARVIRQISTFDNNRPITMCRFEGVTKVIG